MQQETLQYLPVKGPKGVPVTLCFISASKSRSVTLTILTFSKPLDDDAPSRPPKDLHRLIRPWSFETHFNSINVCAVTAFWIILVLEPNEFAVVYPCKNSISQAKSHFRTAPRRSFCQESARKGRDNHSHAERQSEKILVVVERLILFSADQLHDSSLCTDKRTHCNTTCVTQSDSKLSM